MPEIRLKIYPQYELTVNGATSFVSMTDAARAMGSEMEHACIGNTVRESDDTVRRITPDEKTELDRLSQEWASMQ